MRLDVAPLVGDARARRVAGNRPAGEAVIVGPRPVADLRETLSEAGLAVVGRQTGQSLARLASHAAAHTRSPLVLSAADLTVTPVALLDLVDAPTDRTAALTITRGALDGAATAMPPVRVCPQTRRIRAAGTALHPVTCPTCYSVGVLRVRAADRLRAAELWRAAAASPLAADPAVDPFDLALLALVCGGLPIQAAPVGPYAVRRGPDHAPGAPGSPWQQRLRGASRGDDGAFSTAAIRPISRKVTAFGLRRGWTPNIVTLASLLLGLLACALVATDTRGAWVAAAVLLQVSLVIDCVDGEIARFTRTYSALGGWLDAVGDRVKEFTMVGAVGWVAAQRGEPRWILAIVLLALLAARHVEDYSYARRTRSAAADAAPELVPPTALTTLTAPTDPAPAPTAIPRPPHGRAVLVHRLKQVVHVPIAERYLIMSIGLLTFSPTVFLWALTLAMVVAFGWTELGRTGMALLRRDRFRTGRTDPQLVELLDLGALAAPLEPSARWLTQLRLGWQVPWLVLAAESAVALVAAGHMRADRQWAAYVWLAALCWHRYDLVYRLRETGRGPARWLGVVTLGSLGRVLLLAVALAAGWPVAALLAWGALVLIVLYAAEAAHDWIAASRSSRRPDRAEVAA